MRGRSIALVVAMGCAAGGCASTAAHPSAQPSASPSSAVTQASPSSTTVTVTQTPTPTSTPTPSTPTPSSTPTQTAASPQPSVQDPAAVVSAYYAAINAQDYATAWNLGGDNLGADYNTFAGGFATTAHDTLTITSVQGGTVDVHVEALLDNGTTTEYEGVYQVSNGKITAGELTLTSTAAPTSPNTPPQGAVTDPHGGHYKRGEFCPDADVGLTTIDADGNTLTCIPESGAYHWH